MAALTDSADTLAAAANGLGRDMLQTVLLAYDGQVLFAPAMNPTMFSSEAVVAARKILEARGAHFVEPSEGDVACGEQGQGKLAAISKIVEAALTILGARKLWEGKSILVTTRREAGVTRFFVENFELSEVTVTFDLALANLKGNVSFPHTATFSPGGVTEAFEIAPVDPEERWEYSFTNYYKLGSNCAVHDDSYPYRLPYAAGESFRVSQGYNGTFSHKGSNQYAIDWRMPPKPGNSGSGRSSRRAKCWRFLPPS